MEQRQKKKLNPYISVRSLPVGVLNYPFVNKIDMTKVPAELEKGEKELLYHIPLIVDGGDMLNLGDGGSSILLALSLQNHKLGGEVYSVDCYTEGQKKRQEKRRADLNIKNNFNFLHMTTEKAFPHLKDKNLTFLFIDADHSYESCKKEFLLYSPKIIYRGLLGFHDVNQEGVDRVIKECVEPAWDLVLFVNRIKVFKRKYNA